MNNGLSSGVKTQQRLQLTQIPLFILSIWMVNGSIPSISFSRLSLNRFNKRIRSLNRFPTVKSSFLIFHVDIFKTNLSSWPSGCHFLWNGRLAPTKREKGTVKPFCGLRIATRHLLSTYYVCRGASWWLSSKESACSVRDVRDPGLIPRLGRFPGGGHGNPLQSSCLENPADRGAW